MASPCIVQYVDSICPNCGYHYGDTKGVSKKWSVCGGYNSGTCHWSNASQGTAENTFLKIYKGPVKYYTAGQQSGLGSWVSGIQ